MSNDDNTDNGLSWVKLHRSLLEWEWWDDDNTLRFFLYCLMRANWRSGNWHGEQIPAGSFISSYQNMANESGLTVQKVRTAIKHLVKSGEITCKSLHLSTRGETLINVVKWGFYQGDEARANKRLTRDQQTTNKRLTNEQQTTNNNIRKKEYKEEKEEKEKSRSNEQKISYEDRDDYVSPYPCDIDWDSIPYPEPPDKNKGGGVN